MTVASSPRLAGPSKRAVSIPVAAPQAWMSRLVESVPKLAREKIKRELQPAQEIRCLVSAALHSARNN